MTEVQSGQTREQAEAALHSERNRQAQQRTIVAVRTYEMRQTLADAHEEYPCHSGTNEFLHDIGVPAIPDLGVRLTESRLLEAALTSIALPDLRVFSAYGLEQELPRLQEQGAQWTARAVRKLEELADDRGDDDVDSDAIRRLIRELRGEPEPAAQSASLAAEGTAGPAALAFPAPERGQVDVGLRVAFAIRIPGSNISGAPDNRIRQEAEATISRAIRQAIAGSQYGASIPATPGIAITSAVQRGL